MYSVLPWIRDRHAGCISAVDAAASDLGCPLPPGVSLLAASFLPWDFAFSAHLAEAPLEVSASGRTATFPESSLSEDSGATFNCAPISPPFSFADCQHAGDSGICCSFRVGGVPEGDENRSLNIVVGVMRCDENGGRRPEDADCEWTETDLSGWYLCGDSTRVRRSGKEFWDSLVSRGDLREAPAVKAGQLVTVAVDREGRVHLALDGEVAGAIRNGDLFAEDEKDRQPDAGRWCFCVHFIDASLSVRGVSVTIVESAIATLEPMHHEGVTLSQEVQLDRFSPEPPFRGVLPWLSDRYAQSLLALRDVTPLPRGVPELLLSYLRWSYAFSHDTPLELSADERTVTLRESGDAKEVGEMYNFAPVLPPFTAADCLRAGEVRISCSFRVSFLDEAIDDERRPDVVVGIFRCDAESRRRVEDAERDWTQVPMCAWSFLDGETWVGEGSHVRCVFFSADGETASAPPVRAGQLATVAMDQHRRVCLALDGEELGFLHMGGEPLSSEDEKQPAVEDTEENEYWCFGVFCVQDSASGGGFSVAIVDSILGAGDEDGSETSSSSSESRPSGVLPWLRQRFADQVELVREASAFPRGIPRLLLSYLSWGYSFSQERCEAPLRVEDDAMSVQFPQDAEDYLFCMAPVLPAFSVGECKTHPEGRMQCSFRVALTSAQQQQRNDTRRLNVIVGVVRCDAQGRRLPHEPREGDDLYAGVGWGELRGYYLFDGDTRVNNTRGGCWGSFRKDKERKQDDAEEQAEPVLERGPVATLGQIVTISVLHTGQVRVALDSQDLGTIDGGELFPQQALPDGADEEVFWCFVVYFVSSMPDCRGLAVSLVDPRC